MKIGKILKKCREEAGYTQTFIASRIGVSSSTLSGYETGYSMPPVDILISLADIYGVSLDEITGRKRNISDMPGNHIPIVKSLTCPDVFSSDNISGYFPVTKSFVKFKSFIYQVPDDLFYNCKIGRGDFLIIATDAAINNGDIIIYSKNRTEIEAGIFNCIANDAVISDFKGKVRLFDSRNKINIKGVVTHKLKRLK